MHYVTPSRYPLGDLPGHNLKESLPWLDVTKCPEGNPAGTSGGEPGHTPKTSWGPRYGVASGCSHVPCFSPITCYPARPPARGVVFNRADSYPDARLLKIPCRKCIGCRLSKSQEWATRCVNEAKMHDANCFLTLTYSDENLPDDYSVSVRPIQLFMKRLRKHLGHSRVRNFYCGEYGDQNGRPHYHMLLFGYDFPDKKLYSNSRGNAVYESAVLDTLWPLGHARIGQLSAASAAYVARYAVKKIGGQMAESHYTRLHPITGELVRVTPEFVRMSNQPGIGSSWLDKYSMDVFPSDFLIVDGRKVPIPAYYAKRLSDPESLTIVPVDVAAKRARLALKTRDNKTPERLEVREEVLRLKIRNLKREL